MTKMTMTQKLLARGANLESVKAGDLITVNLDMVLGNDITSPVAIKEFNKLNLDRVFDTDKVTMVMDHFTPNKDIKAAMQCKECREFALSMNMHHFYEGGNAGVEHALLPEKGMVTAGDIIIGADSHTCTYGAIGAFATGVGSTDMAAGMATGKAWLKVPTAIKFTLTGKPGKWITGKDIILYIIGLIGVDGALYKSMEFVGDGIQYLSVSERFTIANMAIEAGAKNGVFEVDDKTIEFLKSVGAKEPIILSADKDAEYDKEYVIDLSKLSPVVAFPHLPENTRTFDEINEDIKIDQVVIGSCTNGRIEDLMAAAQILKGRKVNPNVRTLIIPTTPKVYSDALEMGLLRIFLDAGAIVSAPTCGPCLGGHMGILAKGERCVSTTNRNFVGRMGHVDSEVYLASPYVAAASAITGKLSSPSELE